MDLGHFTVVLANFIATFRLYSDNLLQATLQATLQANAVNTQAYRHTQFLIT